MYTQRLDWPTRLLEYFSEQHPLLIGGIHESRTSNPDLFDRLASMFMGWAEDSYGESAITTIGQAYESFTLAVNFAQARYEAAGRYVNKSSPELYAELYGQKTEMTSYILGVYATNFLWSHHLDLADLFESRFISRLNGTMKLVELGSGHGGWGLWASSKVTGLALTGIDISPTSVEVASRLATAAQLNSKAIYLEGDATDTSAATPEYDAAISCFLLEHLEEPLKLFNSIASRVKPGGLGFVTAALTAAQIDHIYEFKKESELVVMAEAAGFRVLETRCAAPLRTLRGAKFIPRVMALTLLRE